MHLCCGYLCYPTQHTSACIYDLFIASAIRNALVGGKQRRSGTLDDIRSGSLTNKRDCFLIVNRYGI